MFRIDFATVMVAAGLSLLVLYGTSGMAYWRQNTPGPAFMPFWVAMAGFICAGLLALEAWRKRSGASDDYATFGRPGLWRVLTAVLGMGLFVAFGTQIGFVLAAALLSLHLLIVVQRRPFTSSLLCTSVIISIVYGVFVLWFGMPLPRGPLGF